MTFNRNEEGAVNRLFDDLLNTAVWTPGRERSGIRRVQRGFGADVWQLDHVPLKAQGNVHAAVQLADFFTDREAPNDSIVFYGCAGALSPSDAESVFLVENAQYLSLGKVRRGTAPLSEVVTLNNKWLCNLTPRADVAPLGVVTFPICSPGGGRTIDLPAVTGLPVASVAATDKVITVGPTAPPSFVIAGMAGKEYSPAQWRYGTALGLMEATSARPVIVDMESYGIGRVAHALFLEESVAVLRVTTDALTDKARSDEAQQDLLLRGRVILAHVLIHLFAGLGSRP